MLKLDERLNLGFSTEAFPLDNDSVAVKCPRGEAARKQCSEERPISATKTNKRRSSAVIMGGASYMRE